MGLLHYFKRYNSVAVLTIHWSNDDMKVVTLEDELCQVFQTVYGYTVERYCINAIAYQSKVRSDFRARLKEFMTEYDREDNLLIVVYSGHAGYIENNGEYTGEYMIA